MVENILSRPSTYPPALNIFNIMKMDETTNCSYFLFSVVGTAKVLFGTWWSIDCTGISNELNRTQFLHGIPTHSDCIRSCPLPCIGCWYGQHFHPDQCSWGRFLR